jgi:NAD(P)H-quinone oxidoreductase subunit 4
MTLLLLLVLPSLAGLLLPLLPEGRAALVRALAAAAALAQLGLGLLAWRQGPAELSLSWLPRLGLGLELGLDGLSLPLVLLTALLTAMAVLASPADQLRPRLYYPLLLATNLGVVGAFLARNALLFVLAFELVLIPTTLLVAIWGRERRAGAAIRYLLYGAVSGLSLLGAVLAYGWLGQGAGAAGASTAVDFSFAALAAHPLPAGAQAWVLALLLLGFGLKLPLVPLHGWQPLSYSQASTPVVMLLGGAVSKLGGLRPAALRRGPASRHLGRLDSPLHPPPRRCDPSPGGGRLDAAGYAGKFDADHRHLQSLCGADGFLLAGFALHCRAGVFEPDSGL